MKTVPGGVPRYGVKETVVVNDKCSKHTIDDTEAVNWGISPVKI